MSVVFSGTNQGSFVSTGQNVQLNIRSGVDYIWVKNKTVLEAAGGGAGADFYWQLGMAQGSGLQLVKEATIGALVPTALAAGAGFYVIDSSINVPGPSLALTGITGAAIPVVNSVNTGTLQAGDIVRIFNTVGALQLAGLDFTVDTINAGVSFNLAYMAQIVAANPGAGTFRRIPFDPIYYPRRRYITKITQAAQAVVTLSVTHGYTIGQKVRFVVPAAFGMQQLDGVQATIVNINTTTNTITIDVDTTGFTAFAFPLTAAPAFTPAQVVPMGENTAEALNQNVNILGDSTVNTGFVGIQLQAGANSPAGSNGDVIYWVAGKSFNV